MTTDEGGDGDGQFYLPGGHLMSDDVLEECQEFSENVSFILMSTLTQSKSKICQVHCHLDKFYHDKPLDQLPRSVGHFFKDQIQAFLAAEKDVAKLKVKSGFCDWLIKWELVDTGVDNLNNQSVRSWMDYIDYSLEGEEGEPVLAGGYSSLVTFLLSSLEGRVRLRPGCSVAGVDWAGEEEIRVRTEAGESYSAQYVVISLPLGVLKAAHSNMFSPSLPKQKIEIIEQLHFGVMNKIFLSFDQIFWDQDKPGIQFIKTDLGKSGKRVSSVSPFSILQVQRMIVSVRSPRLGTRALLGLTVFAASPVSSVAGSVALQLSTWSPSLTIKSWRPAGAC